MALGVNNMSREGAEIKADGGGRRSGLGRVRQLTVERPCGPMFLAPPVLENLAGGISAGGPHHATPGMRAGSAQVETAHRGAVVRVARRRAQEEELLRGHFAVEDVPLGEAENLLQVPG